MTPLFDLDMATLFTAALGAAAAAAIAGSSGSWSGLGRKKQRHVTRVVVQMPASARGRNPGLRTAHRVSKVSMLARVGLDNPAIIDTPSYRDHDRMVRMRLANAA